MNRRRFGRLTSAVGVAALLPAAGHAQTLRMEVIDLRWRRAEEVLPVLRGLVSPPGTVGALGGQIVLRATPAEFDQIKAVLDRIDRKPRTLLITVKQDTEGSRTRQGAGVTGTLGGDDWTATLPGMPGDPANPKRRAEVRIDNSRSASQSRDAQTVQVLEGSSAYIATGTTVPIPQRRWITTPNGTQVLDGGVAIREAATGFTARPRVNGDVVTIDIVAGRERFTDPGRVDTRTQFDRVDTTVQGRLGEWIAVGGGSAAEDLDSSGLTVRSTDAVRDNRQVFIKVEELK